MLINSEEMAAWMNEEDDSDDLGGWRGWHGRRRVRVDRGGHECEGCTQVQRRHRRKCGRHRKARGRKVMMLWQRLGLELGF